MQKCGGVYYFKLDECEALKYMPILPVINQKQFIISSLMNLKPSVYAPFFL